MITHHHQFTFSASPEPQAALCTLLEGILYKANVTPQFDVLTEHMNFLGVVAFWIAVQIVRDQEKKNTLLDNDEIQH